MPGGIYDVASRLRPSLRLGSDNGEPVTEDEAVRIAEALGHARDVLRDVELLSRAIRSEDARVRGEGERRSRKARPFDPGSSDESARDRP
jgi:hypothetical protein